MVKSNSSFSVGMRGRMIRGPVPPQNIYNHMQQQRELVSVPLNDQSGGQHLGALHSGSGIGYKRPMPQDNNQNYPMHGEVSFITFRVCQFNAKYFIARFYKK
jgi:hypothetical protein